jgi:hypothetical protein
MAGHFNFAVLAEAANMARALEEPARVLEVARHHKAIIGALNNSHVNGEQDALCVFEAVAHTLAQLIGGMEERERAGILGYVTARAETLHREYLAAGKVAEHRTDQ